MKHDWHFMREPSACLRAHAHEWAWPGASGDVPGRGHALPIIFERLWANSTISWNGDSVADEAYAAMVCELRAHGFEVSIQNRGSSRDSCPARVAAFFTGAEAFNKSVWWNEGVPETGFYVHETDTFVIRKGWGIYFRSDVQAQFELVDVLVTSWGLHYPPENVEAEDAFGNTTYGRDMTELFDLARSWKGRLVVKEVSAQHFRATGSYVRRPTIKIPPPPPPAWEQSGLRSACSRPTCAQVLWEQGHPENWSSCACEAMNSTVIRTNWGAQQLRWVRGLHRRTSTTRILRFYDHSAEHPDMHIGVSCNPERTSCTCDCTHYCYQPAFWQLAFAHWLQDLRADQADRGRLYSAIIR